MTCPTPFTDFWLGPAGQLKLLPPPDSGYESNPSMSETVHKLISGGVSVTRRSTVKRDYPLKFGLLSQDEADVIYKLYARAFGPGPYCLIEPTMRNLLPADVALTQGTAKWTAYASSLSVNATAAPPADVDGPGVLKWTGAGNGSLVWPGKLVGALAEVDPAWAVPLVPGQPQTVSIYARTAAGAANVLLHASPRNGDATVSTDTVTGTLSLTTAWRRLSLSYTAGTPVAAKYLAMVLQCTTVAAPDIWLSAPQHEMGTPAGSWNLGFGVPRVLPLDGPATKVKLLPNQALEFPLSEV